MHVFYAKYLKPIRIKNYKITIQQQKSIITRKLPLQEKNSQAMAVFLNRSIAVLIPVDWERHAYMVKSALKKVGLFVLRDDLDVSFHDIDYGSTDQIYYAKADFMKATVMWKNGKSLNTQEKLTFLKSVLLA